MQIQYNNNTYILGKKERKISTEAPAVQIKMEDGSSKVIGMMAEKIQVMITLPFSDSCSKELLEIVTKYKEKSLIYLISSNPLDQEIDPSFYSTDFYDFSLKFGVNIDQTLCAKSIFIINKDGEFVYREIVSDLANEFDLQEFEKALDEAIKFRKKGHVHENWMGV